jgi:competence protein ComEA
MEDEGERVLPRSNHTEMTKERTASASQKVERININKATIEDLKRVRGIGQVRAENIIDYLTENGPIKNIDRLLDIRGIGPGTIESIKELFYANNDG